MRNKKNKYLIIFLVIVILLAVAVSVYYFIKTKKAPKMGETISLDTGYKKGGVSFLYPKEWVVQDQPTVAGLVSVQLLDPENNVVFVTSSHTEYDDPKVDGKLEYEKALVISGVTGKERLWQNDKGNASFVVLRADHFFFKDKYYRFEILANVSRKIRSEKYWKDLLSTIKFEETAQGGITPAMK